MALVPGQQDFVWTPIIKPFCPHCSFWSSSPLQPPVMLKAFLCRAKLCWVNSDYHSRRSLLSVHAVLGGCPPGQIITASRGLRLLDTLACANSSHSSVKSPIYFHKIISTSVFLQGSLIVAKAYCQRSFITVEREVAGKIWKKHYKPRKQGP